jgi:hypothetical protein
MELIKGKVYNPTQLAIQRIPNYPAIRRLKA